MKAPLLFVAALTACADSSSLDDIGRTIDAGSTADATVAVRPSCEACQAIRRVRVVDKDGTREARLVLIQDGRVVHEDTDPGGTIDGVTEEFDGTNATVFPGLWDMHVHLGSEPTLLNSASEPAAALRGLLYSGVTGYLDTGSFEQVAFSLRKQLRDKTLLGPRGFATGPLLSVPGGHPCVDGFLAAFCKLITDTASIDTAVDDVAQYEPDVIKLVIEGGTDAIGALPSITATQAAAVVQAAQGHGIRVVAHVSSADEIPVAVQAGVAALVHAPAYDLVNEDQIAQARAAQLPIVSTISAYSAFGHYLDDGSYLDEPLVRGAVLPATLADLQSDETRAVLSARPEFVSAFRQFSERIQQNVGRLHAGGVPIMLGTDAGNFNVLHGPAVHRELQLLVQAGLTPTEAITAATRTPAEFFGLTDVGLVREGFVADLVLVDGDVSTDIRRSKEILQVWQGGRRINRDNLDAGQPLTALREQAIEADIDGFCISNADCGPNLTCEPRSKICLQQCSQLNPCPSNHVCVGSVCYESEGCDPIAQDCPYADIYQTTCTPFSSDYTYCAVSGPATEGEACTPFDRNMACAQGLYCGQGDQCYILCDPAGEALMSCSAGDRCADLSSAWGHPVGLCVP